MFAPIHQNRKAQTGRALLLSGIVLMLMGSAATASSVPHLLTTLSVDALGVPLAAAMALLRFLRTVAFHPFALFPYACGILVLFLALIGILAGLVLLRNQTVEKA